MRFMFVGFIAIAVLLIFIFILAGTWRYWQAWLFGAMNSIIIGCLFMGFADRTMLISERINSGTNTKWWDKVFWIVYGPMNLAIIIIASLDAGRYHWTPALPASLYVLGYALYLFSNFIHLWAILSNEFYASTVRIQDERGQVVVVNGPYRWIRHPGYLGISLMLLCIAIVLGSLRALIPVFCVWILLILRTYMEDKTLQKELDGYSAYAQKTKYRLLPGIW